jgi:hypothetical protein
MSFDKRCHEDNEIAIRIDNGRRGMSGVWTHEGCVSHCGSYFTYTIHISIGKNRKYKVFAGKKLTDKDKKLIFKWLWQEKTVKILAVQLASACQSHFLTKLKITHD